MSQAPFAALPAETPAVQPFPRVFRVANLAEFLERAAFYGTYVNLTPYLSGTFGLTDAAIGDLMAIFAFARAWIPSMLGPFIDRIGYRTCLALSFVSYAIAYGILFAAPAKGLAYVGVLGMGLAGALLKPVIPSCVKRYSPPGRQALGFSIFYAMVNAGSVFGKVAVKQVRTHFSLRATLLVAVGISIVGLFVILGLFSEPHGEGEGQVEKPAPTSLSDVLDSIRQWRLWLFLLAVSGYYLLIEQFYQTFPLYIVRMFGEGAPREYITLINPISIAILGVPVGYVAKRLSPLWAITTGMVIAGASMFVMGAVPTLVGACLSFFTFAIAEMIYSPSYYAYVGSFAPKGKEGLYMGYALLPFGLGGIAGGILSGRMIAAYLPKDGPLHPLPVWGTYAGIGFACAVILLGYRALAGEQKLSQ